MSGEHPDASADPPSPPRILALDGLRSVAAILVVLSHLRLAFPAGTLEELGPFYGLFVAASGTIWFLTLGGFMATLSLLHLTGTGGDLGNWWLSRLTRLLWPAIVMMASLLVVDAVANAQSPVRANLGDDLHATLLSAVTVVTFTYNWFVVHKPLEARADLGHLWFLSVQQQFLVLLAPCVLLVRRRVVAGVACCALAVAVWMWRTHVLETDDWLAASVRTTTRSDGLLLGAASAFVAAALARYRRWMHRLRWMATLMIAVFLARAAYVDELEFLQGNSIGLQLAVVLFILAVFVESDTKRLVPRLLAHPAMRTLGQRSYSLYLWHYPIIFSVPRLWPRNDWRWNLVLMLALMAAITPLSHWLLERPAARLAKRLVTLRRRRKSMVHQRAVQPN